MPDLRRPATHIPGRGHEQGRFIRSIGKLATRKHYGRK